MPSPHELLAAVPLFAELDATDLRAIADDTQLRSFEEGEHIFHIGEPGRSMFIVTAGVIQVHHPARDGHFELAQFAAGDFFGEMALLNDAPRSATAKALTAAEALVLDKVDFRRMLRDRPEVALKILQALSVRIRHADELIQGLTGRALRDPLTGLRNRLAFNERVDEEVSRTRRYDDDFSLVLIDFDDFEAVNRRIGADDGDRILAWVGRVLGEHTRGSDVQFRFEDDAFILVCPGTGREGARIVAARLSALIAEARPPIESDVQLSISTGTASCPGDAQDAEALYQAARADLARRRG